MLDLKLELNKHLAPVVINKGLDDIFLPWSPDKTINIYFTAKQPKPHEYSPCFHISNHDWCTKVEVIELLRDGSRDTKRTQLQLRVVYDYLLDKCWSLQQQISQFNKGELEEFTCANKQHFKTERFYIDIAPLTMVEYLQLTGYV